MKKALGWMLGVLAWLMHLTFRVRVVADPRPGLRKEKRAYIYALLHAHQVAAVMANDDRGLCAMVSASGDGDLLVPALRLRGVKAVRGSSRKGGKDKGGQKALAQLSEHLAPGRPVLLAVDGPLGPRGQVHRGVAELALQRQAAILPVVVIPSRRWILKKTWDRFQIPAPFSTLRLVFGTPLEPSPDGDQVGLQKAVGHALRQLEEIEDPQEWALYARGQQR